MDISLWLTFVAASTMLVLIPGPTVLVVLSYALSQGRKVAVSTAAGVALGDLIAMTASLAGLGTLVLTSATAFAVLKWAGAAYLVYLGVKLLRSAGSATADIGAVTQASARNTFWHATTVTALNPKSIAFFIAFVPQFVRPDAALLPQFAILIATFVTIATLNALAYALMADKLRSQITRPAVLRWITRAGGGTLIAMGLATATLRRGQG
ncbi:LysE family translocator [Litoreibacter roseus]|uniref:Lysine transporter LysE n=1 Tax=Litoreibacter roseus TaxID=2601869 RepID=A0A6N6JJ59_9RHOB|nr:LysE family translocator [Litoreibacter roseus]GFE65308.1 lysine transporter LysE [Litoreibacter roseus]